MPFEVLLTDDAVTDLQELYDYLYLHDSPENSEHVLAEIEKTLSGLSLFPERGACPAELRDIGVRDHREVFFKPYRIIYRTTEKTVLIMLIADGRRDIHALLQRRLLRG
ncbi:MAG: type II toxin-antitoxin system RelE/ParE family toxin [Thermovirgaceae bacterium]|nr:type II toxin-antitoxin system RelE/ParE family toxin [Thermovirgaceae bacterium]